MTINLGTISQLIDLMDREISNLESNKISANSREFELSKRKIIELQNKIKTELKK